MSHDSIPTGLTQSVYANKYVTETLDTSSTGGHEFSMPCGSRYTLHDEIAHGGMGIIFHATDRVLGRPVAIKVLKEKYAPDSGTALRFAGEARITSQLQHPGIPPVHDLGTLPDGRLFLAMKLIKGDTLLSLLSKRPTLRHQHAQFLAAFEQVCQAVAYAHSRKVIHRDLKPQNVMVGAFGEVQVMDWGLAKVIDDREGQAEQQTEVQAATIGTVIHNPRDSSGSDPASTEAGSVLGTLAFMPPEQAIGDIPEINAQSDVFGLGAILAVILTGAPPYIAKDTNELRVKAIRGDLTDCFERLDSCEAERELIDLCKRCLAFSRSDRPSDAGVVAREVAAFRACAAERALKAELDRAAEATKRMEASKRRWLWRGAITAVVLSIMGGLGTVAYVQAEAKAAQIDSNNKLMETNKQLRKLCDFSLKSIRQFHSGVSNEVLFSQPEFADLRHRLLESAQDFYEELELMLAGRQDYESRLTLARSFANVGSITRTVGSVEVAINSYSHAVSGFKLLTNGTASDWEVRREQAMAELSLGDLLGQVGRDAEAEAMLREGLDHLQAFIGPQSNADAMMLTELAKAHHTLAHFLEQYRTPRPAVQEYREAVQICDQAIQKFNSPDARNQLALCLSSLGWHLRKHGSKEADDQFARALEEREKLVRDFPHNAGYRMSLASTYQNSGYILGEAAAKSGHKASVEGAVKLLEKALEILEPMLEEQPTNSGLQQDVARCHDFCGILLKDIDCDAALKANQKALAIRQPLAIRYPKVLEYQILYARSLDLVGSLQLKCDDHEKGLETQRLSKKIRQQIVEQNPSNHAAQSELAWSAHNHGFALANLGDIVPARDSHREALRLRLDLVRKHPTNAEYVDAALLSYDHLGRLLTGEEHAREAEVLYRDGIALGEEIQNQFWQAILRGYLLALLEAESRPASDIAEVERQAIANLQSAVAGGWHMTEEHIQQIPCERIRNHAEVQKLVNP